MVRLTDEESAMLRDLAEQKGLSQSDLLRMLLRDAAAKSRPKPKPKRT